MADNDVATRAPESDAQEQPTAQAPAAGEHCVTDRPTPAGVSSTGEIVKLGQTDIDVYISKPSDYPHAPARLLLLLTGGTGIKSVNNQIQADRFASEGYLVLMPDMFGGDTAPAAPMVDDSASLLEKFKIRAAEMAKSFVIDMWLARITPDKVMPRLHKVIETAREQHSEAIRHGGGIYAVGYCIGARFVMHLAQEQEATSGGDEEAAKQKEPPLIKAGALAHPASVAPDDFEGLKAPLSFACVENDPLFPDEIRSAGEDQMADANVEHEVQVYPGVPHGFAVVGEYQDQSIKDAQATAYDQMLKWLQNH